MEDLSLVKFSALIMADIFAGISLIFMVALIDATKVEVQNIKFEGNITIGNYTFHLVNESYPFRDASIRNFGVGGWTLVPSNLSDAHIIILSNRSINLIMQTCNHEIMHTIFRLDFDQHKLDEIINYSKFGICDTLMKKLFETEFNS